MPSSSSRVRIGFPLLVALLGASACASESAPPPALSRLAAPLARGATTLGEALPDGAGAHLAVSLRRQDDEGLASLLRDQQDPNSPRYRAWLSPEQFGERFGRSEADYARVVAWLSEAGFATRQYPNRLFVEASGTAGQVRGLLGVQLRWASQGGRTFRSYSEAVALPADIAPLVAKIGGLDTRMRLRHRMNVNWDGTEIQVLDADDLRTQYDIPTNDTGAAGLTLAVLGTQEGTQSNPNADPKAPFVKPSASDIQTYLTTIAHASATYKPIVLPNPSGDFDYAGSNGEYQLDVEMQAVGAPNAAEIDLVLSPTSLVFQTGAQYIVNTLSRAVAVSTSLGMCESEELEWGALSDPSSDANLMQQAVQQGLAEGQTWFAASGDSGADDCYDDTSDSGNGFNGGNATVDFPCSLPEIVCIGGTQFSGSGSWDSSGKLLGFAPESVCNEGTDGVGSGGGQSMLYTKPTWQQGIGPQASDGRRDVPDFSLAAASNTPGVVDYDCGSGQDSCPDEGTGLPGLDITGGTSVGSPLAAGIFAHLSGQLGCRLGDVHPALYALGAAQQSGGAQPFHDIVSGNNSYPDPKNKVITGFTAATGYDLATGWGSVDLVKLIASWPACTAAADAGASAADAGSVVVEADAGSAAELDAAAIEPDAGATPSEPDAALAPGDAGLAAGLDAANAPEVARDAAAVAPDGGTATAADAGPSSEKSGCGCSAADGTARGWLGGMLALGLLTLRRRRRVG